MKKNTKVVLLEKAAKLFVKHGYSNTTTRMLATAAGIQAPAIYHHFKSKEEILQQIDEEAWRRFREMIFDPVKATADPEERIRLYVKNMISFQFEMGDKTLMMIDSEEVKKVSKIRKLRDREVFDFFRDTLEELAKSRGRGKGINTTLATFSLFALVTRAYRWYKPSGSISPEELADHLTRLFLHGFIGEKE